MTRPQRPSTRLAQMLTAFVLVAGGCPDPADESPTAPLSEPTPTQATTPIPTAAPTATATPVPTAAPTATATPVPTAAPTATSTPVPTAAPTATATQTHIPTAAPTPTATATPVPTAAPTPTATATQTPIPTAAPTPTATATATQTPIPTVAPTPTATATATQTPIPTVAPTPTATATPIPTVAPTPTAVTDADGDGYPAAADCDDGDAAVNPGATEVCTAPDQAPRDEDCDGLIDDDDSSVADAPTWYADGDGDTYGDAESTVLACLRPEGAVADSGDCDDSDGAYHPGAQEACDDPNDYDCDGLTAYADEDGDGVAACVDCDDTDPQIFPGAPEVCDGIDNSCDGQIDEGVQTVFYPDSDGDGAGSDEGATLACGASLEGYSTAAGDCDDSNSGVYPGQEEVLNGLDDNCDGQTDEGVSPVTCETVLAADPEAASGLYALDMDGAAGPDEAFTAWCDMDLDSGGWMMVLNLDTSDGHVMWWADPLWLNSDLYGDVETPFEGDYKGQGWSTDAGASRLLLVVHEQGLVVGWKSFRKAGTAPLFDYFQGSENTLMGSAVLAQDTSAVWSGERLVRLSTELYANHCFDIYGTGCIGQQVYGADGDRIASWESKTADNGGGGLGNWHDMGGCCDALAHGEITCKNNMTFRTTSEAQAGWGVGCGWPTSAGYFGSDTFATANLTCANSNCGQSNWAAPSGYNYDYTVYVGW